jgi:hypothetical protein
MTVPPDVATGGLTELAGYGAASRTAAIVALTLWRRRGRLR